MDIDNSVQQAFDGFFGFLPNLLGFIVILIIGFVVAKIAQAVTRKILEKVGVDRHLHASNSHQYVERVLPGASVSNGMARVVFWLVFAFFIVAAIGALQIAAVTTFMNQVLAYLPNVIVAIAIFVVAALVSAAVAGAITKTMGDTPTGKIAATVLPAVVMVIALFMILEQLEIAPEIVRIAFAATMGAIALGLALAFGLGGRSVAQRMLEEAYEKGRQHKDQVRSDLQTGGDRAAAARHAGSPTSTTPGTTPGTTTGATAGTTTGTTTTSTGTTITPTPGVG
jgi:hypothetical protein